MTDKPLDELQQLRRLFIRREPAELRRYLAAVESNRTYAAGSTVSALGALGRRSSGLLVPSAAAVEIGPLDFGRTYTTLRTLTGMRIELEAIRAVLRRIPLFDALASTASVIAALRQPGEEDPGTKLDRDSIAMFNEPLRSRVANAVAEGATMHAPQLLFILEKLIIAECPYNVPEGERVSTTIPHLLLALGDNLSTSSDDRAESETTVAANALALEVAANTMFNAEYREDSHLALFMRRWVEMPRDAPSKYLKEPLSSVFFEALGFDMEERVSVVISLWASAILRGPIVDRVALSRSLNWDLDRVEKMIDSISMPIDEYKRTVRREVREHSLDWYFTAFSRYPIVKFDDKSMILDPDMLLRRCLGFAPVFEIEEGITRIGQSAKARKVRQAFDDYSERYAREVFESLTGTIGVKRVYADKALKRAYKGLKVADVVVDYGTSWLVVEVTTVQTSRDTVNGASVNGLLRDRDKIIEEIRQIDATIKHLRLNERALTGVTRRVSTRFYPIVVLTEGFPNNPIINSIIREAVQSIGLLTGSDIAPLEIVNLVELDIIEGVSETHGPPLPEILEAKQKSAFHADSLRNFLIGDPRFSVVRPARVSVLARRAFKRAVENLGGTFPEP
ncbi:hypothetical protein [Dactylosporangium sp. NPDC005555]|uniref:hypothetical protein n=1 Tax=Dactylosporangium sp. NPDC005555 TaxID=3154889 RepID=UPI0033B7BE65